MDDIMKSEQGFDWALQKMREGKSVRRASWECETWHLHIEHGDIMLSQHEGVSRYCRLTSMDMMGMDWEIYEHKHKVMGFDDALKTMQLGFMVTRLAWKDANLFVMEHRFDDDSNGQDELMMIENGSISPSKVVSLDATDIMAKDWIMSYMNSRRRENLYPWRSHGKRQ